MGDKEVASCPVTGQSSHTSDKKASSNDGQLVPGNTSEQNLREHVHLPVNTYEERPVDLTEEEEENHVDQGNQRADMVALLRAMEVFNGLIATGYESMVSAAGYLDNILKVKTYFEKEVSPQLAQKLEIIKEEKTKLADAIPLVDMLLQYLADDGMKKRSVDQKAVDTKQTDQRGEGDAAGIYELRKSRKPPGKIQDKKSVIALFGLTQKDASKRLNVDSSTLREYIKKEMKILSWPGKAPNRKFLLHVMAAFTKPESHYLLVLSKSGTLFHKLKESVRAHVGMATSEELNLYHVREGEEILIAGEEVWRRCLRGEENAPCVHVVVKKLEAPQAQ